MHRRMLLTAALGLAGCSLAVAQEPTAADTEPAARPHHTVSLQQVLVALGQRFPMRYALPGVMNLDLQIPRLRLLPQQNRMAAEIDVQAAGPALERQHQGSLAVDFALRYEPGDRTVRAYRIRLQRLRFPTLQPGVEDMLNRYAPALAEQALLEVVLHKLQPKDLALADAMGMQPGAITVTETGLDIGFDLKQQP